jgi:hypothetical protein
MSIPFTQHKLWRCLLVTTAVIIVAFIMLGCGIGQPAAAPTNTPAPTDTPVPPTDTPVPPTDTPVPPTDTPMPPTDTPVPPTDTPVPPTKAAAEASDLAAPPGAQAMSAADEARAKTIAEALAKGIGMEDFVWEAWTLSADATWEDTLSYYQKKTADVGWSPDVSQTRDFEAGKFAVLADVETKSMLVIMWMPNEAQNRNEVLTIFGKMPAKTADTPALKSTPAPTNTPVPPTPKPRPTATPKPIKINPFAPQAGQSRLYVFNEFGRELIFTINNQEHKIPPAGIDNPTPIDLAPGRYTFTISLPGGGSANGEVTMDANQSWSVGVRGDGAVYKPFQVYP